MMPDTINLALFGADPHIGGSAPLAVNPADALRAAARERHIAAYHEKQEYVPKQRRERAGNYTTAYAKAHAKTLGWKVVSSEQYDSGAKRHYDVVCGLDLLCVTATGKLVGIQAAGKGERANHLQRFKDRRGPKKAAEMSMTVEYWVFTRDSKTPIEKEVWA